MAKKSLETRVVDLANELFDKEFEVYSANVREDGTLPDNIEIYVKEIDITKKQLEQLAFLLRKHNSK